MVAAAAITDQQEIKKRTLTMVLTEKEKEEIAASKMAKIIAEMPKGQYRCSELMLATGIRYLGKSDDFIKVAAAFGAVWDVKTSAD